MWPKKHQKKCPKIKPCLQGRRDLRLHPAREHVLPVGVPELGVGLEGFADGPGSLDAHRVAGEDQGLHGLVGLDLGHHLAGVGLAVELHALAVEGEGGLGGADLCHP